MVHIVSTFFLGIKIAECMGIDTCLRSDNNMSFSYYWFLACLYHDIGYIYEYESSCERLRMLSVDGLDAIQSVCNIKYIHNRVFKTYSQQLVDIYLKGRAACQNGERGVVDHGIAGGLMLYDVLRKQFEESWKKRTDRNSTREDFYVCHNGTQLHLSNSHYFVQAAEWMEKAAEYGDDDGERLAAKYRKAAEDKVRAENGDAVAQANLAEVCMEVGAALPGDENYSQALRWAKLSAYQGCPDGHYVLGLMYEHGRGVDENAGMAAKQYMLGAEKGNARCQWNLACLYFNGEGVKRDEQAGLEWAIRGAEQGYDLAERGAGAMLADSGKFDDIDKALIYLERYIGKNPDDEEVLHKMATTCLWTNDKNELYDLDRAVKYYELAAAAGDRMSAVVGAQWRALARLRDERKFPPDLPSGDYMDYAMEHNLITG